MIAIHKTDRGFAPRWIAFCRKNSIPYKEVCCYDNDIIEHLKDCKALMWHYQQAELKDVLTAKRILFALEHAGIKVFPNFNTAWHFDDKVAQKYLLETLGIPHVKSYIFYDKREALDFLGKTSFPLVFKLKGGAGSVNVQLVRNKSRGIQIVKRLFSRGYSPVNIFSMIRDRYRVFKLRKNKAAFKSLLVSIYRLLVKSDFQRFVAKEGGYFYAQEFIPNNTFDIRIIIVNGKAIAIRRNVRPNDFRASGSGLVTHLDESNINMGALKIAFTAYEKIGAQSSAFDFVFNSDGIPLIVEISYGFVSEVYDDCKGYWEKDLKWHNDPNTSKLQDEMVKEVCKSIGWEYFDH